MSERLTLPSVVMDRNVLPLWLAISRMPPSLLTDPIACANHFRLLFGKRHV